MYKRTLNLKKLLEKKSIIVLGPRQTGKSTLILHEFPGAKYINLNAADDFREISARPESIRRSLTKDDTLVIIDEVQKLPSLLNEVQLMIDSHPTTRFLLTGSSARKLRRQNVNLLAGRAWFADLFPLVSPEVEFGQFERRLNVGGIPSILDSPEPTEDLGAYVGTYLAEEIRAEGLTRSLEAFSRFLEVAALSNGQEINFTEVGNDAQVPPRTIREYYAVLQDTLVGATLPCYQKTAKRKPVATSKFFFFDIGVANTLLKRGPIATSSELYGNVLEHLIFCELRAYLSYRRRNEQLCYWRSRSKLEVDFVIGDSVAIEVKASTSISPKMTKGLVALAEEVDLKRKIVVCNDRTAKLLPNGIEALPVAEFLTLLWADQILP
jgi:predicted AAA+ superfamily ATPase